MQIGGHAREQQLVEPHLDALAQAREQRHSQADADAELAKRRVGQRTEHEAHALRAAAPRHACLAALVAQDGRPEGRPELAHRPEVVHGRQHYRAGLPHHGLREHQQARPAGPVLPQDGGTPDRRATEKHGAHVLAGQDAARQLRGRPREPQPACHAGLSGGWRDAQERAVGHLPRRHERIAKPLERRAVVRRVHPRPAKPALRVRHVSAQVLSTHRQARLAVEDARRRRQVDQRGRLIKHVAPTARGVLLRVERHLECHASR